MRLQFRAQAIADIAEIQAWLRDQSPAAAARFTTGLHETLQNLRAYPQAGSQYLRGTRRMVIPRSNYQVIYLLTDRHLVIMTIAQTSRKPGYWLEGK